MVVHYFLNVMDVEEKKKYKRVEMKNDV